MFINGLHISKTNEIIIYVPTEKKEITLDPHSWVIVDLGCKDEIKHADIYISGKLSRKWDISDEENLINMSRLIGLKSYNKWIE